MSYIIVPHQHHDDGDDEEDHDGHDHRTLMVLKALDNSTSLQMMKNNGVKNYETELQDLCDIHCN